MTLDVGMLTAVVAATASMYAIALVAVRLAGRRTVSHFSAFDFLVTIAIGTIVGGTAASAQPDVARGTTAIATLLALQIVVGAVRQRSRALRRLLDFAPIVIVRRGAITPEATSSSVHGPQLAREDVETLLRSGGAIDARQADAAVLEPRGDVSIAATRRELEALLRQLDDVEVPTDDAEERSPKERRSGDTP